MLLSYRITLVIILAVLFAKGNQRIVHVNEAISNINNEYDGHFTCCVYGNCSCNSLGIALASLVSNVLINITSDVILSSLIKVSGLQNVTIIGYNNPTVNCRDVGGIQFIFCHNCVFKDITWNRCGNDNTQNQHQD